MISNNFDDMCYIGQTTLELRVRWNCHKDSMRKVERYRNGEAVNNPDIYSHMYNSMIKHGLANFKIEVMVYLDNEDLDTTEIAFIKEYNTLSPNGYNLAAGGQGARIIDPESKLRHLLACQEAAKKKDLTPIRRDETQGLPIYVVYAGIAPNFGYSILNHPLCKFRTFTTHKYGTMDNCKEQALKFLAELEETQVKYERTIKSDDTLPTGIIKCKNGYSVKLQYNKLYWRKCFAKPTESDEVKLTNAKIYLEKANDEINKLKCPETKYVPTLCYRKEAKI